MNTTQDISDFCSFQPSAEATTALPPQIYQYHSRRYFEEPMPQVICFNCGEAGHMSNTCLNPAIRKKCVYCGVVGHKAATCPEAICDSCGLTGHITGSCQLEGPKCPICRKTGHAEAHCLARESAVDDREVTHLRCLLKACPGHSNCYQLQGYSRIIYCCKCGDNGHTSPQCPGTIS